MKDVLSSHLIIEPHCYIIRYYYCVSVSTKMHPHLLFSNLPLLAAHISTSEELQASSKAAFQPIRGLALDISHMAGRAEQPLTRS